MKIQKADEIRKRYQYRRMILDGTLKLPRAPAVRFVGPDCAYHLYGVTGCGRAADDGLDRFARGRGVRIDGGGGLR